MASSSDPAVLSPVTPNPSHHAEWLAKIHSTPSTLLSPIFSCIQTGSSRQVLIYLRQIEVRPPVWVFARQECCEGGCVSAQLLHPLGSACTSSPAVSSAASLANAQQSSPTPCPLQPGGCQAGAGTAATRPGGCSVPPGLAWHVMPCPISLGGGQEVFALPGLSPVQGSAACCS